MENKKSKIGLIVTLITVLSIAVIVLLVVLLVGTNKKEKIQTNNEVKASEYRMSGNGIEKFDLAFLKLENKEENKIYSPLSIKYALAMLNEGTSGDSKSQITAVIGDYKAKKYTNSKNMSLANALFVRDSLKNTIKKEYTDTLKSKYNAEVIYDSFEKADNVNNWVKSKTLNLIDKLVDDIDDSQVFMLINALGIDMEWASKFIVNWSVEGYTSYVFTLTQDNRSSHSYLTHYGAWTV